MIQGIVPNDNPRLRFQTNVPGFGFGSHILFLYLIKPTDKAD